MDWNTYYEKFYDWSTSTQISRLSFLTSFGTSAEVTEVAQEFMDEKAASRLIKKAVSAGVRFTPKEVNELADCCDTATMNILLESSNCSFTQEQLEDLWGIVDDAVLQRIAAKNNIDLFEDLSGESEIEYTPQEESPEPKLGFFAKLGLTVGLVNLMAHKNRSNRCSSDCSNCPPHYGYRYGRWYYGHHHTHGCELGGNQNDE